MLAKNKEIKRDVAFHYYFKQRYPNVDDTAIANRLSRFSENRESFDYGEAAMAEQSNEF